MMRAYDPRQPLIAIHLPKTGGQTCRMVFSEWFGEGLRWHYRDGPTAGKPTRHDVDALQAEHDGPICIYGHFNRNLGFGTSDYYPAASQFYIAFRDPFAMVVSEYFYKKNHPTIRDWPVRTPGNGIEAFVREHSPTVLNYLPWPMTLDDYRQRIEESFVHVGCTERLERSMELLAERLGQAPPATLERRNASQWDEPVPEHLRAWHRETYPLEYALHALALALNPI